jgi:hypothetical protein
MANLKYLIFSLGVVCINLIAAPMPSLETAARCAEPGQGEKITGDAGIDLPLVRNGGNKRLTKESLRDWRAATISRLRAADLGAFEYHDYQISDRRIRIAEMLVGALSVTEFAASEHGPDFVDLYGFRTAEGRNGPINWVATSPDAIIREKSEYGSFGALVPMAAAYWRTGDPTYMRRWFAIAADFALNQRRAVEQIPLDRRRMENAPWVIGALPCLHQGNRMIAMTRCLAVFAKSLPSATDGTKPSWDRILRPVDSLANQSAVEQIPAEELYAVVRSLGIDHPKLLLDFYQRPGALPNQRAEGLAALLTVAAVFPDVEGIADVAHQAGDAMSESFLQEFHQDGGMLEQSLNYNLGQAERLRQLGRLLRRNPPEWLSTLAKRLRDFDRLIMGISTPLRSLPIIGNNTSNPPAAWTSSEVRRRWFDKPPTPIPRFEAGSLGFSSIAFPYSGYYAQRRDWEWDSPYLFMTNARPTRGHHSMDNLAIEVHAYGRPMLVRGGPPPYALRFLAADRRDDMQKIEEYFNEHSSFKLNTVVVDGNSQVRVATPSDTAHETPVEGRWHATATFDLMDGKYSLGYGPPDNAAAADFSVTHHRRVIHVREFSCWVVSDTMFSKDDRNHEFTQVWKFPPFRDSKDGANNPVCGFKPEQVAVGDASIRTLDLSGPNLWLYQFSTVPLAYSKHVGETDPYRGWYARDLGDLIPAVDAHTTWRATGASLVATLLWPTPGAAPPPLKNVPRSIVEKTGDSASFSASLRNGDTLTYAESVAGPRHFEAAGIRVLADMILVTRAARSTRGLVLGCTEWTDGRYTIKPRIPDFEFVCRRDGGFDTVAPIELPQGFRWVENDDGFTVDYGRSLKNTGPAKP